MLSLFELIYYLLSYLYRKFSFFYAKKFENIKIISIGNITVGGTGKTPAIIFLAHLLQKKGYQTAILSRGYRGRLSGEGAILSDGKKILSTVDQCGDEPYMIAENLKGIPVGIGKNRYKIGSRLKKLFNISIFLLDDGFQHYKLSRDIDILLIDSLNPFGNRRLIPRGILREPISEIKRADIILISKSNFIDQEEKQALKNKISKISNDPSIFWGEHRPIQLHPLFSANSTLNSGIKKLDFIKGKKVWVISGIADPTSFHRMLIDLGSVELNKIIYRDHHIYNFKNIQSIASTIQKSFSDTDKQKWMRETLVVTTEKDSIKLKKFYKELKEIPNFYFLKIEFAVKDQESFSKKLEYLLKNAHQKKDPKKSGNASK